MFKNKLLRALLAPFFAFVDDIDAGGGFDMEAASSAISEGLGFGGGDADTNGDDNTGGLDLNPGTSSDAPAGGVPAGADKVPGSGSTGADAGKPNTGGTAAPPPAGTGTLEAPKTWRPEAAAEWAKLPANVQAEVLKREQDIFQGLESYKADATFGKSFKSVLEPHMPIFKHIGADPIALTGEILNAHMTFATGTQAQKQALLQRIVADYGIDMPVADGTEPPYVDPTVKALQDQLKEVQSHLSVQQQREQAAAQRQQQEVRNRLAAEIDTFAKDPKNSYFDELTDDITKFIQQGFDLQQAYDKAVWANPATRAKEIARTTAEATSKAQAEAAERAKAARQATAANVRTSAKNASGTAPLGSMDDTLKETYARLTGKS